MDDVQNISWYAQTIKLRNNKGVNLSASMLETLRLMSPGTIFTVRQLVDSLAAANPSDDIAMNKPLAYARAYRLMTNVFTNPRHQDALCIALRTAVYQRINR